MSGLPQIGLVFPPEVIEAIAQRTAEVIASSVAPSVDEYLTVPEAAAVLKCGPKRVYDLTGRGLLGKVHDGSRVLVPRTAIDAYLRGDTGLADAA